MAMRSMLQGAAVVMVCALSAQAQQSSTSQTFTLQRSTEAPGTTLKAGSYTISMVDSLADRTVLRIDGAGDGKRVLVLAVRNTPLPGAPGPVLWDSKGQGHHALRGFVFPNGSSVEFVYPKVDAVALAKANHESVVAVDTASENRPELSKLSSRDMQMVNLWMLTPTRVGPEQAMEAKRFVPSGTQTAAAAPTAPQTPVAATTATQTAPPVHSLATRSTSTRATVASVSSQPATLHTTGHRVRNTAAQATAPTQVASLDRPASLPQTAGHEPELWMMSMASLLGAAALRLRRRHAAAEIA